MSNRKARRTPASKVPKTASVSMSSQSAAGELSDTTKLALRVHLRLATCRNLLMREARRSVELWGLTLPQFDVLAELSRAADTGFTFVELSRLLLVTSGNLTGIVDRLGNDGLVRREVDERDRRLVRIVLTPKGRELIDQIMPAHARDIQVLLSVMPPGRLAELNDLLGELRDSLRSAASTADELDARAARPGAPAVPADGDGLRRARGRRGAPPARVDPTSSASRAGRTEAQRPVR